MKPLVFGVEAHLELRSVERPFRSGGMDRDPCDGGRDRRGCHTTGSTHGWGFCEGHGHSVKKRRIGRIHGQSRLPWVRFFENFGGVVKQIYLHLAR